MRQAPTYDDLDWLLAQTRLPVWVKGVLHPDDARLLRLRGLAGIVVSNHGGRAFDSAVATIDVLPEIVEAQKAGIIFDCAHGRNHFNFRMIEKALDQGFMTDTISTDLTMTTATQGPVWDLPTTITKLLHFGMSLEDYQKIEKCES